MSAMGHNRKSDLHLATSAPPQKAAVGEPNSLSANAVSA